MITVAESESDVRITTVTPYLALTDELWGVYCEEFGENWPRYNGPALYFVISVTPWGTLQMASSYTASSYSGQKTIACHSAHPRSTITRRCLGLVIREITKSHSRTFLLVLSWCCQRCRWLIFRVIGRGSSRSEDWSMPLGKDLLPVCAVHLI